MKYVLIRAYFNIVTNMHVNDSNLCCGCLCFGRRMVTIDKCTMMQSFIHIVSEIAGNAVPPNMEPVSLCWECEAQLRNFTKFKQIVSSSYKVFSEHVKQNINQQTIHYLQAKTKLTTHKLIDLTLDGTDDIESLCMVIIPEKEHLDVYDNTVDTYADSNSDDEKLIKIKTKKNNRLNGKYKKKKKRLTEILNEVEKKEINEIKGHTNIKCENCNMKFDSNDALANHLCVKHKKIENNDIVNGHQRKKKRKFKECELFKEVELSRQDLEEERRLARLKDDYLNAMFKCERCIVCFANAEDLQDHIDIKHELNATKFKCDVCECSFGSEISFNYHRHKHIRRYECTVCGDRNSSKRGFMKHYEHAHCHGTVMEYSVEDLRWSNGHGDEPLKTEDSITLASFPCEICHKTFRWKTSLRKHVETHRIESGQKRKPYCEPCRLSFTTTSNLQKHVKTSSKHQIQLKLRKLKESASDDATGEKALARIEQIKCSVNTARQVFPCPHCDKKFQWRGNMLRHLHTHAARAKGELVCEPCNRTFSSIATYKQHMKISKKHVSENDFKYMCSDCGKRFANKTRLKDHINWEHLKNYVHKCSLCQKIFKSHTSLYLHKQVVHKKDNAEYLCHHCGKSFPNQGKLRAHMRAAHSGGAGYSCAQCGARFSWHSCLSRHARRAHKTPA